MAAILPYANFRPYPESVTLYAAYGPSLNPRYMAQRAPMSPVLSSGWLRGWRLTFAGQDLGWDGAIATVVEDATSQVFVMVYDVPSFDERALDEWEGLDSGLWYKIRVRIETMNGTETCWLYALNDYEGGMPSAHYLSVIADAAEAAGAPDDYVHSLRRHPCRGLAD